MRAADSVRTIRESVRISGQKLSLRADSVSGCNPLILKSCGHLLSSVRTRCPDTPDTFADSVSAQCLQGFDAKRGLFFQKKKVFPPSPLSLLKRERKKVTKKEREKVPPFPRFPPFKEKKNAQLSGCPEFKKNMKTENVKQQADQIRGTLFFELLKTLALFKGFPGTLTPNGVAVLKGTLAHGSLLKEKLGGARTIPLDREDSR